MKRINECTNKIPVCQQFDEKKATYVCRLNLRPCSKVEERDCPVSDNYEDPIVELKKIFTEERK